MADLYIEFSIILLSVVAVLSVLIIYIIKQTLVLRSKYEIKLNQKNIEKQLWIDRKPSESHILDIPSKREKVIKIHEESNLEQMVTFIKKSSESVNNSQDGQVYVESHSSVSVGGSLLSEKEHVLELQFYDQTITDKNEYSEYCVPNCEPIEYH